MSAKTRVAIYCRFSSEAQRANSIEDQARNCRRIANGKGWHVVREYADKAMPGTDNTRPQYLAMLAAAKSGEFDVVLLDDLSRLTRDNVELETVVRRLEFDGIRIVTVSDGYDSQSGARKVHRNIKGLMNELALDDLRDRVHRGQEGQARNGYWNGGRPFGYRLKKIVDPTRLDPHGEPERIGTVLEVDPKQRKIVEMIFERRAAGVSCHAIAAELNRRGVPSPGSSWKRKTRRCGGWLQTAVRGIVMNPRYTGQTRWNATQYLRDPDTGKDRRRARPEAEWVTGHEESLRIVSDELFADASKPRLKRNRNQRVKAGGKAKYLLSGLLECGCCGAHYVMANDRTYACSGYLNGRACANAVHVRRDEAERIIVGPVKDKLLSPDRVRRMAQEMQKLYSERAREAASRLDSLPDELRQHDARIERLRERLRSGDPDMTPDEIQVAIEKAEGKRAQLAAVTDIGSQAKVIALMPRAAELYCQQVRAGLDGHPDAVMRARPLLRELIGEVTVLPGEGGSLWASYDFQPAVLLRVGTDGRGEGVCPVPTVPVRVRLR